MIQTSTLTASEARSNLYKLIRTASKGLRAFEIRLRGAEPVILLSKQELEDWIETASILSDPNASKAIDEGLKEAKKGVLVPFSEIKKKYL